MNSWLECINYLRNMSAHYMRLYKINMQKTPTSCKKLCPDFKPTNKVYDIIYIMKFMMPDADEWNNYVIPNINAMWEEYKDYVSFSDYGFSADWERNLKI